MEMQETFLIGLACSEYYNSEKMSFYKDILFIGFMNIDLLCDIIFLNLIQNFSLFYYYAVKICYEYAILLIPSDSVTIENLHWTV